MNEVDFRGESFNNASTIKTRQGDGNNIVIHDTDGSTGREIDFDLTRVDGNQTTSTKNNKSIKHVSFK